jgi:hypothetical protein
MPSTTIEPTGFAATVIETVTWEDVMLVELVAELVVELVVVVVVVCIVDVVVELEVVALVVMVVSDPIVNVYSF